MLCETGNIIGPSNWVTLFLIVRLFFRRMTFGCALVGLSTVMIMHSEKTNLEIRHAASELFMCRQFSYYFTILYIFVWGVLSTNTLLNNLFNHKIIWFSLIRCVMHPCVLKLRERCFSLLAMYSFHHNDALFVLLVSHLPQSWYIG